MYQLKITLVGTEPPVWRRLLVRGGINLGLLHGVIQTAMGWTNSHLHQFFVGAHRYTDLATLEGEFADTMEKDEAKTLLCEVAPRLKDTFRYEYDFGDSWQHLVVVEEADASGGKFFAHCLDGKRACPPEDCGGIWGYAQLLEALKNPKHPEHRSMLEWIGGRFDAEAFDLKKINRSLHQLSWPNTGEGRLARVLMARDGYKE